eukprot:TRINITY_DN1518_c0_g1_i1.p1 TRINITY_DN1518_c0_g1~~TRINITY_DN1518_c0_g1_i1.p1  ORF type:complete len:449 (-),score=168.46 TRINITY_DN1518_c0_g1_i1:1116-2462(-)
MRLDDEQRRCIREVVKESSEDEDFRDVLFETVVKVLSETNHNEKEELRDKLSDILDDVDRFVGDLFYKLDQRRKRRRDDDYDDYDDRPRKRPYESHDSRSRSGRDDSYDDRKNSRNGGSNSRSQQPYQRRGGSSLNDQLEAYQQQGPQTNDQPIIEDPSSVPGNMGFNGNLAMSQMWPGLPLLSQFYPGAPTMPLLPNAGTNPAFNLYGNTALTGAYGMANQAGGNNGAGPAQSSAQDLTSEAKRNIYRAKKPRRDEFAPGSGGYGNTGYNDGNSGGSSGQFEGRGNSGSTAGGGGGNKGEEMRKRNMINKSNLNNRSLNVKNIPPESNNISEISNHFQAFGSIQGIEIHTDQKRAVVRFSSNKEAKDAISSPIPVFGNRFIQIHWADVEGTDDAPSADSSDAPSFPTQRPSHKPPSDDSSNSSTSGAPKYPPYHQQQHQPYPKKNKP